MIWNANDVLILVVLEKAHLLASKCVSVNYDSVNKHNRLTSTSHRFV